MRINSSQSEPIYLRNKFYKTKWLNSKNVYQRLKALQSWSRFTKLLEHYRYGIGGLA